MKNEKMKWYFLIAVALVVGAIIGYFATSNLATTGNANKFIQENTESGWVATEFITEENCIKHGGTVVPSGNSYNYKNCVLKGRSGRDVIALIS